MADPQSPDIGADHGLSVPVPSQATLTPGRRLIAVLFAALFYALTVRRSFRDSSDVQIVFGVFEMMGGLVTVIFRNSLGRWQLRRRRAGFRTYMGDAGAPLVYLCTGLAFIAAGLTLFILGLAHSAR